MSKFRKGGHDVMPPPPKISDVKPGVLPEHRIPIYDHKGHMRGHVGPAATSVSVARFVHQHGAKLGKKDGRTAWLGPKPPPKPKPKPPQPNPAAANPAAPGAGAGSAKLEISLKQQAMGSASKKKPDKPETHARPRRG